MTPPGWGPWHIDRGAYVLWTMAGGYRYEVDLEDCTTSAAVLDWIFQIAGKEWGDGPAERNAVIAGLVNALDDILRPQVNLCTGGQSKRLSRTAVRRLVSPAGGTPR
jgi:hypothetical protein